jgi:transposase-like protein
MLKDLRLAGGQRRGRSRNTSPTLERLGISPNKSSRWQRLAEVSEEDFRQYEASTIASGHIVSSDGLLRVWRRLYQKSKPSRRRAKGVRSAGSAAIGGEASEILGELENHRQTLALLLHVEADSPRSELVLPIIEARYANRLLRDMGDHVRALTTLLAGGRGGTRTPCGHRIA